MSEVFTLQGIILITAGLIIFIVGIRVLFEKQKIKRQDLLRQGKVLHSKHIVSVDKKGYLTENYYDIRVEYLDNGHRTEKTVQSAQEYLEGDKIQIVKSENGDERVYVYLKDRVYGIGAWVWMAAGIAVMFMPFIKSKYGDAYVAALEGIFLLLIGIGMIIACVKTMKKELIRLDAEIVDILKWQNNGKTKGGMPVFCYYPIYQYELEGVLRSWRSDKNSTDASLYKKGKKGTLYWCPDEEKIMEKPPKKTMMYVGIVLVVIAIIGLYGTIVFLMQN